MNESTYAGEGKKKLKKKEVQDLVAMQPAATSVAPIDESGRRTSPEGPAPPVDDDEDIFGDAGRDYVVERRTANAEGPIEHPAKRAYFEDGEELGAEGVGPLSGPAPGVLPLEGAYPDTDAAFADVEARAAQEKRTARDREKRRLEMLAAQDADDGYAECYPSYFDAAGTIYDSEDEDAAGRKNDEGAQEGDARTAARRESAKQAMKEKSKLDTELNQIHKVFEEKGFKDHGAFGKQGVSKKEGEEAKEESSVQVFTKKRRI